MASKNPIVYLIKLISKRMQKEINEETSDVYRKKLEVRDKNLEAIYQSDENREKMKETKEAWANITEKKEKYEKSKDGVSLYDKMVKFLKSLKAALDVQDKVQTANPVTGPAVIASKVTAFIEEQKKELEYIKKVAGTQKKYIKEDLKLYGEALEALIDEINKGDDAYRQEILSTLDPWAQQDPYIADAPYNKIMSRYQERLGAHEVAAAKEQASGGKKSVPSWGDELNSAGLDIRRTSPDLLMDLIPVETAAINVGDEANTDAAMEAQKTLFDYSLVPASVKDMRTHSLGIPFITYYYKVIPNLLESAIRYPEKYAKYTAIPFAAAAYIASNKDVTIEDVNQLKKSMPEWIRDKGSAFLWPYKDENDKWQVFDFSYFLPWSMFTGIIRDTAEGELSEALRQTGALGGPLPQLITAWTTNIDSFTGREISDERDPANKQLADKLNYIYRVAAPTWTTDIGFRGKLLEAINKDVNKYGDPKMTKTQAMLRLVGVNLYPIDPEKSRKSNMNFMLSEIQQIKSRRTQVLKDKNLSKEERENLKNKYDDILRDRMEQLRDYKKESKIPEALK